MYCKENNKNVTVMCNVKATHTKRANTYYIMRCGWTTSD